MANTYDINANIRASMAFANVSGVAADPTTVTFKFKDPSGNTTTYVYGTDVELVQDATGNYHVDIVPDESGTWYVRAIGTGAVIAAAESNFEVRISEFS